MLHQFFQTGKSCLVAFSTPPVFTLDLLGLADYAFPAWCRVLCELIRFGPFRGMGVWLTYPLLKDMFGGWDTVLSPGDGGGDVIYGP